jgi:hypothetical protein
MTDTPETDSEHQARPMGGFTLDFCRQFERERNDAIEMMKRTKDNSGEIIASQANENILLTEQRDRLAEALWSMLNQDHGSAVRAGILLRSLGLQYLNQTNKP